MGYKGIEKEYQLNQIVDQIIGDGGDTFKYDNVVFEYNSYITEDIIRELSKHLKGCYPELVNANNWYPIRLYDGDGVSTPLGDVVDEVIDSRNWMGKSDKYIYDRDDRQEILQRCAERIEKRLSKYAKGYRIRFKVFGNGNVGFRYE